MYEAVCISDLHIGASNCKADRILNFLNYIEDKTKLIIINGDLFDHGNTTKITDEQWLIIEKIKTLRQKIVLIKGNHDVEIQNNSFFMGWFGLNFIDNYTINIKGDNIYFHHGDIFDSFIKKYPLITKFADWCYTLLQKLDKDHKIAEVIKHNTKAFLKNNEVLSKKSIELARKVGYKVVVAGHTHHATTLIDWSSTTDENDCKYYFNTGSWVDSTNYFVCVHENGVVSLEKYNER